MLNLFDLLPGTSAPTTYPANWNTVRAGLRRNLNTIITFHRENPAAVKSDHFLVRLLQSLPMSYSISANRYADYISGMALNLSMALKMTSSISKGNIFKGTFYGPGNSEVLVAHCEDFDPDLIEREWVNAQPVQVLRQPRSDLNMNLPDGINTGTESGIVVIAINIPELAVMYRAFCKEQEAAANLTGEARLTVMQFVHMYVLPNMLFSHIDTVILNRIRCLKEQRPYGEATKRHSFVIQDYDGRLNDIHTTLVEMLNRVTRNLNGVLQNVPCVFKNTLKEACRTPDMAATRQVMWALAIARLPALIYGLESIRAGAGATNAQEGNKIAQNLRYYNSSGLMRAIMTVKMYSEVENEMQTALRLARS